MRILDIAKAIAAIDENDKKVSKEHLLQRINYLKDTLKEVYDNLEGSEQYALGDVLNLLILLKNNYENNNSENSTRN